MTRRTSVLLAALTLSTALFVTSCSSDGGGDDGDGDASGSPTVATSPTAPGSSPAAPPASSAAPSSPDPSTGAPATSATPGVPSSPGAPNPSGSSGSTAPQAIWHPSPGTAWQWQLSGTVDQSVDVPVYDIDGFENDASVVASLHAKGRKVICYINAGSWETFRPDAGAFPQAVQGSGDGWKGEKWLDIRQLSVLRPLMTQRFQMCKAKGFDAVEPDLLEAYANKSGFPLTAADQLAYNKMIADIAHQLGLGVALKNDVAQVSDLVDYFDFSVDEQCAEFQECDGLTPFIKQGKAVLHVEYNVPNSQYCAQSKQLQLSSMEKHLELDAWRAPC
ncbi:endo alpha-1,4 polygalactosaminidase [Kitasatospora mediocidica]|uniref:endo alpha-1,4 polygalactosaminidase n=1 Tax=Kitasatospora mediocidica TaxID=58352 RepID=UPI000B09CA69|nr:endo alpha-1,4 polygalactosaminidase [Kitasatospora mediocidica]